MGRRGAAKAGSQKTRWMGFNPGALSRLDVRAKGGSAWVVRVVFCAPGPRSFALGIGWTAAIARPLRPARHGPPIHMILPQFLQSQTHCARLAVILRRGVFAGLGLLCLSAHAQTWTTLDLPNLSAPPGVLAYSNLADGQLVYGNSNFLYLQNSFGSSSFTAFATAPGVDPSFLTVLNGTTAVVGGGGGFGPSAIYQFNPSNTGAPGYAAVTSLQNYGAARASNTSLYVVGSNGSGLNAFDGPDSAVSYVTLAGQQRVLVDHAGGFSSGVAVDTAGDLFVGDDDTYSVYEFTAAQVQNAITNSTTLVFGDGALIHTFADDVVGSITVDADGRIWAAGFGAPGLYWFNPVSNSSGVFDPQDGADDLSGAYSVGAFSANGTDYVSYVWQSDFSNGSSVVYGYANAATVPEPASAGLWAALVAGMAVVIHRRRRKRIHV